MNQLTRVVLYVWSRLWFSVSTLVTVSPPPSFSFLQSLTDMFNFSAGFLGVGLTRPKNHSETFLAKTNF